MAPGAPLVKLAPTVVQRPERKSNGEQREFPFLFYLASSPRSDDAVLSNVTCIRLRY